MSRRTPNKGAWYYFFHYPAFHINGSNHRKILILRLILLGILVEFTYCNKRFKPSQIVFVEYAEYKIFSCTIQSYLFVLKNF